MNKKYKLETNYAIPPYITLKEKLEEIKMTPKELAIKTNIPQKIITNIIKGKTAITSEIAIQLEKVLNIPAKFWIAKRINYDEYIIKKKEV